ncbi:MAG: EipA family protein [Hyphomicrobiales bacterium]|nr:EipA family protein [Hyphomicrobiales bacterium]
MAATFDEAANTIRNLNADSEKRFMAKIRAAGERLGWSQTQIMAKADAQLDDPNLADFNGKIEALVSRMDDLSRVTGATVACDRLDELRRTRDQLLTIMGQKSGYMLAELDGKLTASSRDEARADPQPRDDARATPPLAPREDRPVAIEPPTALAPPPKGDREDAAPRFEPDRDAPRVAPERRDDATAWRAEPVAPPEAPRSITPPETAYLPPLTSRDAAPRPGDDEPAPLAPPIDAPPSGFTIADIREAGRGVFGTLSSELAAVINYAFQSYGYPTAYIAGSEGGGALLAGLRWGKGRLNLKDREPMRIHWRGPSLGLDFGASGSNVMLLVYNLKDPGELYETFTGVEGSAYVVGGVGLNVLKHRNVIIVPIRTGLGLRVGANVGYLKFTEKSSWNPF